MVFRDALRTDARPIPQFFRHPRQQLLGYADARAPARAFMRNRLRHLAAIRPVAQGTLGCVRFHTGLLGTIQRIVGGQKSRAFRDTGGTVLIVLETVAHGLDMAVGEGGVAPFVVAKTLGARPARAEGLVARTGPGRAHALIRAAGVLAIAEQQRGGIAINNNIGMFRR